jgi:hypothetical protein
MLDRWNVVPRGAESTIIDLVEDPTPVAESRPDLGRAGTRSVKDAATAVRAVIAADARRGAP